MSSDFSYFNLEGQSWDDFLQSNFLYDEQKLKEEFLPYWSADSTGDSNKLDPGLECYLVAQSLAEHNIQLAYGVPTDQQVDQYRGQWFLNIAPSFLPDTTPTERELTPILKILQMNPEATWENEFYVNGKLLKFNQEDVNGYINDRLAIEGSRYRFMFLGTDEKPLIVYGPADFEKIISATQGKIRSITISNPLITNAPSEKFVMNDTMRTVVVVGSLLGQEIKKLSQAGIDESLLSDPQKNAWRYLKESNFDETQQLESASQLVGMHEIGHYRFFWKHGSTISILNDVLFQDDPEISWDLYDLREIFCDLESLRYLIDLSKSDPEKAAAGVQAKILILGKKSEENPELRNTLMPSLLLSCISDNSINWDLLASRTNQLEDTLTQSISSIEQLIKKRVVEKNGGDTKNINTSYDRLVKSRESQDTHEPLVIRQTQATQSLIWETFTQPAPGHHKFKISQEDVDFFKTEIPKLLKPLKNLPSSW